MIRRRLTAAAVVLPLLVTTACSSSGKPSGTSSSSRPSGSSSGVSGAALAAQLHTALNGLTSAKIGVDAGGLLASMTGQLQLVKGTATGSRIVIGTGKDTTTLITVDGKSYAKLPSGENTSGKPYVLVSANSSNEFVRAFSSTVEILDAASSLGGLADLVSSASGITDKGTSAGLHHITFSVTGDKTSSSPLKKVLGEFSTKPVPVDLYLDSKNRPTKVAFALSVAGSAITITVNLSDFNVPVMITAPAPNQVAGA
ncbi:hypothetical protein [Jatrophihabitans sp.]|uniref:hypothetical protein n=1 Tax=Jatrophihabitans sp. TaxID=1932789 RepID=UPI0030C783B8|nr:hypothetical protein [Jatrophihabitans sp.]